MVQCKCGRYRLIAMRKLSILDLDGNEINVVQMYFCQDCQKSFGIEEKNLDK